ncbi:glycosyltransferase [Comamonas flocculans]|uniref:Glycosyltransferase n=1 Tax=Comamonas flocculans TaxID=2597701 RepID=A0A5B8RW85_9BURK|nr:glycosyltransferase [Comamonas flocculans]QEA12485.1 glycosyltransferase [Comamonas flocculans]
MNKAQQAIGIVVIGRNEGERLRVCLQSVAYKANTVVYVDSGSTDDSVALARSLGVVVVPLDMSVPFTAARARNAGFQALRQTDPEMALVQFVDGDCEVVGSWLLAASEFLTESGHERYAVVCGRRRERHPARSIYNRLCDVEWDTPVGDAKACGGDAMMRTDALQAVGGYRDDLIAGEEPELCVRLRAAGWKVRRLDQEMTLHDADITRLSQWWRRATRGGYAFAQGAWLHGASPERHWVRETYSALFWGVALPLIVATATLWLGAGALLLLLVYPAQVLRLYWRHNDWERALFLVLGKFAEGWGVLKFVFKRVLHQRQTIIEYK